MGVRTLSISIQEIPQFIFDELHALIGKKTKEKLFFQVPWPDLEEIRKKFFEGIKI